MYLKQWYHVSFFSGCTAQEVHCNKDKFNKAEKTLKHIGRTIRDAKLVKVDVTRENIFDYTSGPLYLLNLYL